MEPTQPQVFEPYPTNFPDAIVRLRTDFAGLIGEYLSSVLDGVTGDTQRYVAPIVTDLSKMFDVPEERRQKYIDECVAQLGVVGEISRLKINNANLRVARKGLAMLSSVVSVAISAASMNIPGILNGLMSGLMEANKK